jgi:hypothetical protein
MRYHLSNQCDRVQESAQLRGFFRFRIRCVLLNPVCCDRVSDHSVTTECRPHVSKRLRIRRSECQSFNLGSVESGVERGSSGSRTRSCRSTQIRRMPMYRTESGSTTISVYCSKNGGTFVQRISVPSTSSAKRRPRTVTTEMRCDALWGNALGLRMNTAMRCPGH